MMKIIFLLLMIIPYTVFAECRLTELEGKFEGVCWGYNPMSPPVHSKKNRQHNKKNKVERASKVELESATSGIAMTEEELKFMQARNRMDGYRGKVQVARK
jgi:hypothetical protein